MLELRDYLDLSEQSVSAQWRAIFARRTPLPGKRQEDFLPIETLLCFGLGLIANQSASGSINIPESSPDARSLAQLFKRTPKSLAAKLANLDGGRSHSAKHEQDLWIRLTGNITHFESLYALILDVGRSRGLGDDLLPDFLGFGDQRLQIVYEADRVTDGE